MISTVGYFVVTLLILILVHEFGHFIVARCCGVTVERFSFGFGKVLWAWRDKRGTEYAWSLWPLGGYVKLLDDSQGPVPVAQQSQAFHHQSSLVQIAIILAGPLFNFLFAFFLFWVIAIIGVASLVPTASKSTPVVETVAVDSPAQQAGLQPEDEILAIDHQSMTDPMKVSAYIKARPGATIVLEVRRRGRMQQLTAHLRTPTGYLGIGIQPPADWIRMNRVGPIQAAKQAFQQTLRLTAMTFGLIGQTLTGQLSLAHLSGPIGIAKAANASAHAGLTIYLTFLALLSISLGVLNVLPIPMLDGGHLLYRMLELVMRRPLSLAFKSKSAVVGMIFIVILSIVALKNDLRY